MSTTFSEKETSVSVNPGIYFVVNSLPKDIAKVISQRMKALGELNPNEVERRSHDRITSAGVRKILKGETDIMVESLVIIAKALDTSVIELLAEALNSSDQDQSIVLDQKIKRLVFKLRNLPPEVVNFLEIEVDALYGKLAPKPSHTPGGPERQRIPVVKMKLEPERKKRTEGKGDGK